MEQLDLLKSRIGTVESRSAIGTGTVNTGLLGGSTTAVVVTFNRPMPDTSYSTLVQIDPTASLLGGLAASVTSKTTAGCTVTVRNTSLVTLSTSAGLTVLAVR